MPNSLIFCRHLLGHHSVHTRNFPSRVGILLIIQIIIKIWKRIRWNFVTCVLAGVMFHQLILSIVFDVTKLASIWLVICVTSFVVFAVTNCGESFLAIIALVRLLTCMSPHVDK